MRDPGLEARWQVVCDVAARAYDNGIDALACIEILERGNSERVIAAVNLAGADRAMNRIKWALLDRILFLTMKAYSRVRKGDRHMRMAFDALRDDATRSMAGPFDKHDLDTASHLWDRACTDPRLIPLTHYRDKHAAHIGDPDPDIADARIMDLFGFARLTAAVAEKLAAGTGVAMVPIDHQIDAFRESADAFWSRFTRE